MSRCRPGDISEAAAVAEILLKAGDKISGDMRDEVRRIGKDFEFHRERFNKDYLAETETGLSSLYELFGVEPVARRVTHDGVSPITVPTGTWQNRHSALWEFLVPSQGAALTVQGEAIRITGRISYEILDNGGANWDADFRKMCDALLAHLSSGKALDAAELDEAAMLINVIRPKGCGDTEPARLCELAVKWVLLNPTPIPLGETSYRR